MNTPHLSATHDLLVEIEKLRAERDELLKLLNRAVDDKLGDNWRQAARAVLSKAKP